MSTNDTPRVYLAGKVAKHDWRHSLFALQGADLTFDHERQIVQPSVVLEHEGFRYAGPYFLADDHGCYHGPNQHGLIDPGWACDSGQPIPNLLTRQMVQRSCLAWLDSADVVFAWIDRTDAYGTLVELGYAAGRGIPIFLAFNGGYEQDEDGSTLVKTWPDLWFAAQTATRHTTSADVADAWSDFQAWWSREMRVRWSADRASVRGGEVAR